MDFLSLKISEKDKDRFDIINSKQLIIDILCHCLKFHGQRMRYYTIHNDLLNKVLELTNDNLKIIDLMVVKFMKSVVYNNVCSLIISRMNS